MKAAIEPKGGKAGIHPPALLARAISLTDWLTGTLEHLSRLPGRDSLPAACSSRCHVAAYLGDLRAVLVETAASQGPWCPYKRASEAVRAIYASHAIREHAQKQFAQKLKVRLRVSPLSPADAQHSERYAKFIDDALFRLPALPGGFRDYDGDPAYQLVRAGVQHLRRVIEAAAVRRAA